MNLGELVQPQSQTKNFPKALASYLLEVAQGGGETTQHALGTPAAKPDTPHPKPSPLEEELKRVLPFKVKPPARATATTPALSPQQAQAIVAQLKRDQLHQALNIISQRRVFLQKLMQGQKVEYFDHFICQLQPRNNPMYQQVLRCHQIVEGCLGLLLGYTTPKKIRSWVLRLYEATDYLKLSMQAFGYVDPEYQSIRSICSQWAQKLQVGLPKVGQAVINLERLGVLEYEIARAKAEAPNSSHYPPSKQPAKAATPSKTATPSQKDQANPAQPKRPITTPSPALDSPLKGKRVLLVGGDPKAQDKIRLEHYTGAQVTWVATKKHGRLEEMIRLAYSHDMVFLLIRWSSHSYGILAEHCKKAGVPLVRLTHGYNARRVVQTALEQASLKLGIPPCKGEHAQSA